MVSDVEHGHILLKYFPNWSFAKSQQIVYGRRPSAIINLQLEGDDLTHPAFYQFTDYLDLLNKRIHAICAIVKENHNQTIEKRLQHHGSESPALCSFNEGDIVYCHFPSKTIISDQKLTNVFCWNDVYIFVPTFNYRQGGHQTDVPCLTFKKGSIKVAQWIIC